jgi:hypothetical protein
VDSLGNVFLAIPSTSSSGLPGTGSCVYGTYIAKLRPDGTRAEARCEPLREATERVNDLETGANAI